jgi:uncharacterized protein (UPF0332 family)
MVKRELKEARHDLESAQKSLEDLDHKWAIIKAYFSMFHAFRSLLFSAGYTEKSHECVVIGVEELFIDTGKLPSNLITCMRDAKVAREAADYGRTYGEETARGMNRDAAMIYHVIEEYHKTTARDPGR